MTAICAFTLSLSLPGEVLYRNPLKNSNLDVLTGTRHRVRHAYGAFSQEAVREAVAFFPVPDYIWACHGI